MSDDHEKLKAMQDKADQMLLEIVSIKNQLAKAAALALSEENKGIVYSDWYVRAKAALKHKQAEYQILLRDAGVVRAKTREATRIEEAKARKEQSRIFACSFLRAAKRSLDEPTYLMLLEKAAKYSANNPEP